MICPGEFSLWMCILLLLDGMFFICVLGPFGLQCCSSLLFPNFMSRWSIHCCKWAAEVPYYRIAIFPIKSVNTYFIHLGALLLGTYIFIIVISSWWIDSFIIIYWLCLLWQFLTWSLFCLILSNAILLSFGYHLHGRFFPIPSLLAYMCP